jgi:protein NRD1
MFAPGAAQPAAPAIPNSTAIMEALANIARQNTTVPPSNPSLPAQEAPYHVSGVHNNMPPQPMASLLSQTQPAIPYLPTTQSVSMSALPFTLPAQAPVQTAIPGALVNPSNPYPPAVQQPPANANNDPTMQQQLILINTLLAQGVPYDKIPTLIQSITGALGPAVPQTMPSAMNSYSAQAPSWSAPAMNADESRDRLDGVRSPNRYRERSRSRSPNRQHWGARNSPRSGRESYGRNSPSLDRDRGGRGRSDYRQRSPSGRHQSHSPQRPAEKWMEFDPTLAPGHIKVLSRTLFVGGVT